MEDLFGAISPALLLAMVITLVEFFKQQFNWDGGIVVLFSTVVGILLSVGLQAMQMYPQVSPWVTAVIYGILFGLSASGLYKLGQRFLSRS